MTAVAVPGVVRSEARMGTVVRCHVLGDDAAVGAERAMLWFQQVEAVCDRFNPRSELSALTRSVGRPVTVSEILAQAVGFAVAVAEATDGAFSPVIVERGDVSYHDIELNPSARTIRLRRPLQLDLGAVAKGLAVDLAAHELEPWGNFCVDAGGDLYVGGTNGDGEPWSVGIRDPRDPAHILGRMRASNQAVCSSGEYERGCHIRGAAGDVAGVTVVAGSAMVADALGTGAYVLGAVRGAEFLTRQGVAGLIVRRDGIRVGNLRIGL